MPAITVDYIDDWAARLRSRLYTQFRNKTTWEQWVQLLAEQSQDFEDAAQTMFTLLDIDNSEGPQLDLIGRIVGQLRGGATDAQYRRYLKARAKANISDGTAEELYAVINAFLPDSATYETKESTVWYKQFILTLLEPISATEATVAQDLVSDAKEAGAWGIMKFQEYDDGDIFTLDGNSGQGFDVAHFLNARKV